MPEIGWIGVVALAAWVTYVFAGLRSTILVTASFLLFGVFGLWADSMDTLIITGDRPWHLHPHRPADRHLDGAEQERSRPWSRPSST